MGSGSSESRSKTHLSGMGLIGKISPETTHLAKEREAGYEEKGKTTLIREKGRQKKLNCVEVRLRYCESDESSRAGEL